MSLTPQQWLNQMLDAVYTQNLHVLPGLEAQTKQSFARARNWNQMEHFYEDVLFLGVKPQIISRIGVLDLNPFKQEVMTAFETAIIHAEGDKNIEAFYFEYFYDGSNTSTADVFLCTHYSNGNDEHQGWTAEFNGIITGPSVAKYMSYDLDDVVNPSFRHIIDAYVDARFLASLGMVLDQLGHRVVLPVGFAKHDRPLITILPKTVQGNGKFL